MNYYALLSVSDKTGIVDFAEGLIRAGYTLISSGGTHAVIQAEDGIRDRDVTGVQTCALPISTTRNNSISKIN